MNRPPQVVVLLLAAIAIWSQWTDNPLTCGPFPRGPLTFNRNWVTDVEAFNRGELGIIQPTLHDELLVMAYRHLTGKNSPPQNPQLSRHVSVDRIPETAVQAWVRLRFELLGDQIAPMGQDRRRPDYSYFLNCPDPAFRTASDTLHARTSEFGANSVVVREWVKAQDAVFSNCSPDAADEPVLPTPLRRPMPSLIRADREYQIASAYFYAMEYEEAERRFRAIANDPASPWARYGRYLAARSLIRRATLSDGASGRDKWLAQADADLRAIMTDTRLAAMHQPARELLEYVEGRQRPAMRLFALSDRLRNVESVDWRDVREYVFYLHKTSHTPEGDDLTAWILALEGPPEVTGEAARTRWKQTRSPAWLVAAWWNTPAEHVDTAALLAAAATIDADAHGYETVQFLRVRTLLRLGQTDVARRILNDLLAPGRSLSVAGRNLFLAQRFSVADSLPGLVQDAMRRTTSAAIAAEPPYGDASLPRIAFDWDAADTFTFGIPLRQLAAVAESSDLPEEGTFAIAAAAWTRAVLLNRFDVAARMAPIVRTGAPFLGADLDRIARATTDDERLLRAAVLMLGWPGLHPYVPPDPSRRDRTASGMARVQQLDGNWWCTLARVSRDFPRDLYQTLESDHLQFLVERRVEPLFLTAADRDALVEELSALENVGGHTNYFAPIVLRRARTHPDDPDVPEALARIVRGARYGDCRDEDAVRYARRAFQLLHQQYPRSVWAKRTPYWYR